MLRISAIVLIALVVEVVSRGRRLPPNRLMPKKLKNGNHTANLIIIRSISCVQWYCKYSQTVDSGNDFNTWILYHCKEIGSTVLDPQEEAGKSRIEDANVGLEIELGFDGC